MKKELSVAEFLAVSSSTLFLASVLYELAYFSVIDFGFFGLLTTADLFKLLLVWLPILPIAILGVVLFDVFRRIASVYLGIRDSVLDEINKIEEFDRNFDSDLRGGKRIVSMLNGHILIFSVIFILFLYDIFLGSGLSYFFLSLVIIFGWVLTYHGMKSSFSFASQKMEKLFLWLPIFIVFSLGFGGARAQADLKKTSGEYVIILNGGQELTNVQMLKSLEGGVILRFPDERVIRYLSWSGVAGMSKDKTGFWKSRPFICYFYASYCDEKPK